MHLEGCTGFLMYRITMFNGSSDVSTVVHVNVYEDTL